MKKIVNNSEIAILLGVYNGAKYIEEQIESILSQSQNSSKKQSNFRYHNEECGLL